MPVFYYFCPVERTYAEEAQAIYRQVDLMNQLGFKAFVVRNPHIPAQFPGYVSATKVPTLPMEHFKPFLRLEERNFDSCAPLTPEDVVVVPHHFAHAALPALERFGLSAVILSLNVNATFCEFTHPKGVFSAGRDPNVKNPYTSPHVFGTLVVNEKEKSHLQFIFPGIAPPFVVHLSPPPIFCLGLQKRKTISFLPRQHQLDATQVVNIIRYRGHLSGWLFYPILLVQEAKISALLQQSMIYMSFSTHYELGPLKAMAAGATVIGYTGSNGQEFVADPLAFPIEEGDQIAFAKQVEEVALRFDKEPSLAKKMNRDAAEWVKKQYGEKREKEELLQAFTALLKKKK